MDIHIVENKTQLEALLRAAAEPTAAMAKLSPFKVRCGTTKYIFREGLTEHRALQIIREIRRTSAKAFSIHDTEPGDHA